MNTFTCKPAFWAGWLVLALALGCDGAGSAASRADDHTEEHASAPGDGPTTGSDHGDKANANGDNGGGGDGDNGGDGDGDSSGDGDGHSDRDGGGDGDSPRDGGNGPDGQGSDGGLSSYANVVEDGFDAFDADTWSCEYTCPTVSEGHAGVLLEPGIEPDNEGSWSKIGYRPTHFTGGRFTVRFALSERPAQKVWWGVALWDDGANPDDSEFNEINFGYTTNQSFTNTQLLFESARRGNFDSVKVDLGTDLYDGSFHTATLEYDATQVAFYFDGELMHTITDPDVIPTDPMEFIIGPRLVTGSAPLEDDFTETVDWTRIEW